jgi:hypothetical protein
MKCDESEYQLHAERRVERGKWLVGISHWENGNIPISH